jgi:hypothetical protein
MATIFETLYSKPLETIRVSVGRKLKVNWKSHWSNEKLEQTPQLSVRLDCSDEEIYNYDLCDHLCDYTEKFWDKQVKLKNGQIITNHELYELELNKVLSDTLAEFEDKWNKRLKSRLEAQKEKFLSKKKEAA